MRLPSRMIFSLQISEEGLARIRAGTTGAINSISYKTMSDDHIIFNIHEWKNFVELHHDYLQVGQVILLTGRTISRCNIQIMFVIDIIFCSDQLVLCNSLLV